MSGLCPPTCPIVSASALARELPVGQVRRIAPADPPAEVDETKRNVLKLIAVAGLVGAAGGGLVGGSLQFAQPPTIGASSYPKVQLLDLDGSALTVAKVETEYNVLTADVLTFPYPLRNEPNFLINLAPASPGGVGATNVKGGIGHQKSIVAFSAICQHLGCPAPAISYFPPGTCQETPGGRPFYVHCTCHGSTYDAADGAAVLTGPAVLPLPQVTLEWHSDDTIWAVEVTGPPVNGHLDTLTGDYPVANQVSLTKQSAVPLCNFPQ